MLKTYNIRGIPPSSIRLDDVLIDITITEEEEEDTWYVMHVTGTDTEFSGRLENYDESWTHDHIIHYVIIGESQLFSTFREFLRKEFFFRIRVDKTDHWVFMSEFMTLVN